MSERRRICWPSPDATCLEGGCLYCNDHPYRSVATIRAWAQQTPTIRNRGDRQTRSAMEAFQWGEQHHWGNADV
jgi:hypothetical protein